LLSTETFFQLFTLSPFLEKAIYLSREAEKFLNNDDVIVAIYLEEEGTEKS